MIADELDERQIADWVRSGPSKAPVAPIALAAAHARTHPHRHSGLAGPWRALMTRMSMTEVQPRRFRHFDLAVTAALVAIMAVAICSMYLLSGPPPKSEPAVAVPVASPTTPADAVAPVRPGWTPPATPAAPGSPSPTPASTGTVAYVTAAPNGMTIDDIAGTWTGTFFEPTRPFPQDTSAGYATHLTIGAGCTVGRTCARMVDTSGSGGLGEYALTYLGYREDVGAFVFDADDGRCARGGACPPKPHVAFTPMPGGETMGAMVSNGWTMSDVVWYWYGLFRSATP